MKYFLFAAFLLATLSHASQQRAGTDPMPNTVGQDQPAQIYFYRENHIVLSAGRAQVLMDGKIVCMLRSSHYCAASVPAGEHIIGNNEVKFMFEAGQTYYLKISGNKASATSWLGVPEYKATLEPDGAKKIAHMKNNTD
jgi:hypothetical protein